MAHLVTGPVAYVCLIHNAIGLAIICTILFNFKQQSLNFFSVIIPIFRRHTVRHHRPTVVGCRCNYRHRHGL